MAEPQKGDGLYSNLLRSGSASPTGGMGIPDVGTLVQIRNKIWDAVIPDSRLKNALMGVTSIFDMFKLWRDVISGAKYSQGEYEVGALVINKLQCNTNVSWKDIPDDFVPVAKKILTMLFGVKIMNSVDVGRLTQSATAYYNNNANRLDQPQAAVNRAVWLAQNVFNPYNSTCVDIRVFDNYPLVAPIPDMTNDDENQSRGKYYTGIGLNGQSFTNGLLTYNSPSTGLTQNLQTNPNGTAVGTSQMGMNVNFQKYAPIFAILLVIGVIFSIKTGLYKPA